MLRYFWQNGNNLTWGSPKCFIGPEAEYFVSFWHSVAVFFFLCLRLVFKKGFKKKSLILKISTSKMRSLGCKASKQNVSTLSE